GEKRLFTFARVFRNGERSALHHPEFTMLEWYRAGEPYETLMQDCAALVRTAAQVAGGGELSYGGRKADAAAPFERLTVADAFQKFAAIDLLATLGDTEKLAAAARAAGIRVAADDSWSDIFSRVLVERVEGRLGLGHATILDQYPAPEAAWARPARDPRVAER